MDAPWRCGRAVKKTIPYDRAAIMRDSWKRFRDGQRLGLGWSFGQCLSTAWAAAKMRRASEETRQRAAHLQMTMTAAGWGCRIMPAGVDLQGIASPGNDRD